MRLARIFSDHVVLQRERPVPIWGWGEPGESVRVAFGGQSLATTTDRSGKWRVQLAPMPVSASPQELTVTGNTTIRVSDVLVGDVWLCSGQSNMAFGLGGCDAEADIQSATFPAIRFLHYWERFAAEPQDDIDSRWQQVNPTTAGSCMAVAFYFARRVYQETKIPIGLVACTVGGTEIECWMPPEAFRTPSLRPIEKRLDEAIAQYQATLPGAVDAMERWLAVAKQALAQSRPVPNPPRYPLPPNEDRNGTWVRTQSLFKGMVAPLTSLAIKGVLWYQGENNGDELKPYIEKQQALIESWRARWGYDFPFYFVQLASWLKPSTVPSGDDSSPRWQRCREAQLASLKLPKTGMAVTIDIGDPGDIHPKNKLDVGERLALWALAKDYGRTGLVYSGPLYKAMQIEGRQIRLQFDHLGGGLMVGKKEGRRPVVEDKNGALKRFAIAGADRVWQWADAKIEGGTVVVSSSRVTQPTAVRYAYALNPEGCNLYNRAGLPAFPFRTDKGD
jgi:sialate O-acetylesterase